MHYFWFLFRGGQCVPGPLFFSILNRKGCAVPEYQQDILHFKAISDDCVVVSILSERSSKWFGDEIDMISTGCLKKNVVSWKNSHNYLQTHPKCKSWGCFGKFRIFATRWALRFSKLKKK